MAKTRNRLSAAFVKNAKSGVHHDGGGLYLQCTPRPGGSVGKSWLYRFAIDGRERRMGLGPCWMVSLAEARNLSESARRLVYSGADPIVERDLEKRRRAAEKVTFRQAFDTFFASKVQTLANAKHRAQWPSTMETYVFPIIGDHRVDDITASDVIEVVSPIWFDKPETARRVLQRMEAVFKSAIVRGHRHRVSPCIGVAQELGIRRHRPVAHFRALPYAEIPHFLVRLRTCNSWPATRLGLEWLVLTATRSGETRRARWSEIDEANARWAISADRMKTKREHVVPLAPRSMEILHALRTHYPSAPSDLLFPGSYRVSPLSETVFIQVLRNLGLSKMATAHGMRSAFKTWCAEVAKVRDEVSEAALAHVVPEKVRAAYLRAAYLEERTGLMAAWAAFCTTSASAVDASSLPVLQPAALSEQRGSGSPGGN